ncbi:MAG: DUF5615 family PIN-like protein [Anaerolineales bacterium]|nr:DUF5615 family PIN-like protein [Anaerolineales bacterium]
MNPAVASLRFYLDENVPVQVARQLSARGIDVVTARDLGLLGEADANHLQNAARLGRVFCTHDSDLLQLAASGFQHAGIVFGQQSRHYIGEWVNWLTLMHAVYTIEEMLNRIEYL